MMKLLGFAGVCGALVLFSLGASLAGEFYSFDPRVPVKLVKVDVNSGVVTDVGSVMGVGHVPGLDFHPCTGKLYGADRGWLITYDIITGQGSLVASLHPSDGMPDVFPSLAFSPDGVLYGAATVGDESWLYRIELDGTLVKLVKLENRLSRSGMDFDSDGTLYVVTGGSNQGVYIVNMATGAMTLFAGLPDIVRELDLAVDDLDQIYVSATVPSENVDVIYRVSSGQAVRTAETNRRIATWGLGFGPTPARARLNVVKFYDANANGLNDDGQLITGWEVQIEDIAQTIEFIRFTPESILLDPGTYLVSESVPIEPNWMPTTDTPVAVDLAACERETVEFGNLCLGAGGGLTLGFWSNKNGEALFGADDLALMVSLGLRNADGSDFDPASYAAFRTWLLSAAATNMAHMLSAQLAAMELNVLNGKVDGGALIYAPGTLSANALGFATVSAVMAEADTELGSHGLTLAGSPDREYQEALKRALDNANNNKTFVQPGPCVFTFGDPPTP